MDTLPKITEATIRQYATDTSLKDQQIKTFQERWQAVAAIEAEEQRAASVALHWQQLNAIVRLAIGLGTFPQSSRNTQIWLGSESSIGSASSPRSWKRPNCGMTSRAGYKTEGVVIL